MAVSATNRPFLAADQAQLPVDLARTGYVEEEEYQLSGLANIYQWGATPADPVTVRDAGVPYVTRISCVSATSGWASRSSRCPWPRCSASIRCATAR